MTIPTNFTSPTSPTNPTIQTTPAIFLDRDGTLVHPRPYPSRPEHLRLYDDIGAPLAALQRAGFRLVVITNQSGIARGYFTEDDLAAMHAHLAAMLAAYGVTLDGIYYCPHHVDGIVAELAVRCACRKPQPGMVFRAARELRLDLARSWFVGDILDDVEAGKRAGCRTVLVDLGTEPPPQTALRDPDLIARDTRSALNLIAGLEGIAGTARIALPERAYRPASWPDGATPRARSNIAPAQARQAEQAGKGA